MFKKIRNIETAFQNIRLFCLIMLAGSMATNILVVFRSYQFSEKGRKTIYILSAGKAFQAFASERERNILVEARDHIRTFHQLFFSLAPDEKVINNNISRALYLADGSAKKLYENLKENGYYAGIVSGNINQSINVDSISLDMDYYPFYFKCWCTQQIVRPTSVVIRNLITEGRLRNSTQSDNNAHGFLIEHWNTLENKDIKVESR